MFGELPVKPESSEIPKVIFDHFNRGAVLNASVSPVWGVAVPRFKEQPSGRQ